MQRFKETGHPEFESISALSRRILKHNKGKTSTHFNGDSMNTELLFQTIHYVNQLSVYGAVTDWCYQFGSTEEEKGRASTSMDDKILTKLKPTTLGISSDTGNWKQDARKSLEFRRAGR